MRKFLTMALAVAVGPLACRSSAPLRGCGERERGTSAS